MSVRTVGASLGACAFVMACSTFSAEEESRPADPVDASAPRQDASSPRSLFSDEFEQAGSPGNPVCIGWAANDGATATRVASGRTGSACRMCFPTGAEPTGQVNRFVDDLPGAGTYSLITYLRDDGAGRRTVLLTLYDTKSAEISGAQNEGPITASTSFELAPVTVVSTSAATARALIRFTAGAKGGCYLVDDVLVDRTP